MKLAVFYLLVIGAVLFTVPNLIYHAAANSVEPWHLASTTMAVVVGVLTLLISTKE